MSKEFLAVRKIIAGTTVAALGTAAFAGCGNEAGAQGGETTASNPGPSAPPFETQTQPTITVSPDGTATYTPPVETQRPGNIPSFDGVESIDPACSAINWQAQAGTSDKTLEEWTKYAVETKLYSIKKGTSKGPITITCNGGSVQVNFFIPDGRSAIWDSDSAT